MSTNAHIAILKDGKYTYIYSHWDGYPEHVGKILYENYNTTEKIEELIALGDISSLGPRLKPNDDEAHSFDNPIRDITIAYHRDRGEDWEYTAPHITSTLNGVKDDIEFAYIFNIDDESSDLPLGKWVFYVNGRTRYDLETEYKNKFEVD